MGWHLKDRELEQKLIEICPNFLDCVDLAVQIKGKEDNFIYVEFNREKDGDDLGFNYLYFWLDELEDIPEYNPKTWNEWPGITPPVEEMMRVDCFDERGTLIHSCCGYWNGKCWMTWNGYKLNDARTIRFRSWEE